MNSRGTSSGLAKLQASTKTYYIGESKIANGKVVGSHYNSSTKTINVDLFSGIYTTDAQLLSPATMLGHEVAHAVHDDQGTRDTTADNQYDTTEERNTITSEETEIAKKHGEIPQNQEVSRKDHRAAAFDTQQNLSPEEWEERCRIQNF